MASARFKVAPALARVLGEAYKSSEAAIRELVDNAWDAEATEVSISLPEFGSDLPIIVVDNGSGMTEADVRQAYLTIASSRASRKGAVTPNLARPVRGRRGIGKFAGLTAADVMQLSTTAERVTTDLRVTKEALESALGDMEEVDLPLSTRPAADGRSGTTITLSGLNQRLTRPSAETLRALLVRDYGRSAGFQILVNGEALRVADFAGVPSECTVSVCGGGSARISIKVLDEPIRKDQAGIVLRVAGKVVGQPSFYGLDSNEHVPRSLLGRIVGEVEADCLADVVTADWAGVLENSVAYQEVKQATADAVRQAAKEAMDVELEATRAAIDKEVRKRLARLPEPRRCAAERVISQALHRLYGERIDRVQTLVTLLLDAIEQDAYYSVCKALEEADGGDVEKLASIMNAFGLADLATMAAQAMHRLRMLVRLDQMLASEETQERNIHTAIERNSWVLGSEYEVVTSNATLTTIVSRHLDGRYTGTKDRNRPDLLLWQAGRREHYLVEFKRPSHTISLRDITQAQEYRHELEEHTPIRRVIVLGGTVAQAARTDADKLGIEARSYAEVVSEARESLRWASDAFASEAHL